MRIRKRNALLLFWRGMVFLSSLLIAIFFPWSLAAIGLYRIWIFRAYHLTWAVAMIILVSIMLPYRKDIRIGKIFACNYREKKKVAAHDRKRLSDYTRKSYYAALRSFALWLFVVAVFSVLYILTNAGFPILFAFVAFAYLLDEVFVSVWCPFRNWLNRNKCCYTCRIHNWGGFMFLAPFVLEPSFWTLSLVIVSFLVIVQWEYQNYRHPERFYYIYNLNLQCRFCRYRTAACRAQKP